MKKMNRREFLTLTGASVALLALAACGGAPSTPVVPTGKEAKVLEAINKVWKEKHDAGAVVHEQLTLNQDAVGAIRCYGRVFEEANETPHTLKDPDHKIILGNSMDLRTRYGTSMARKVWQVWPASPNRLPRMWWLWRMRILARMLLFGLL